MDGLRNFCIKLLDLEVNRAKYNLLSYPVLYEPPSEYRTDISAAGSALRFARWNTGSDLDHLDLPCHWLTLLGHRLAVELGLRVEGTTALAHVASARLDLPLKETITWSEDTLFHRYTQTVLRDEWDYPGLLFRGSSAEQGG